MNLQSTGSFAIAPGTTIAFESIDGPPPEVFNKLVAALNEEAKSRQVAVVSRQSAATYRVRGYVSAQVEQDKTTFAWVWDIYDADKRRTQRVSGAEPAGRSGRSNAWTSANDQVVQQIASNGMSGIIGFLGHQGEPAPASTPIQEPNVFAVAASRDDSPEAAGIFRRLSNDLFGIRRPTDPETTAAAPPPSEVPAPPRRPATRKPAPQAGLKPTQDVALAQRQ